MYINIIFKIYDKNKIQMIYLARVYDEKELGNYPEII